MAGIGEPDVSFRACFLVRVCVLSGVEIWDGLIVWGAMVPVPVSVSKVADL